MSSSAAAPQALPVPASDSAVYAGLVLATFGWASSFLLGKVVLTEMSPLACAMWRYALAASVLLPFAYLQRPVRPVRHLMPPLAAMVVCGGVLYPWVFLQALSRTSATNTALLIALNPALAVLFSPLVGERLSRRGLIGVALAFGGAVTVITKGDPAAVTALELNGGDLLALLAAVLWASYALLSRRVVAEMAPSFVNCVVFTAGSSLLFLLARAEAPWAQLTAAAPAVVAGLVTMTLASCVIAGHFYLTGLRHVGVGRAMVFVYLVPVLTAALAVTFLGERFTLAQVAGGAAVLIGVYWTTRVGRA